MKLITTTILCFVFTLKPSYYSYIYNLMPSDLYTQSVQYVCYKEKSHFKNSTQKGAKHQNIESSSALTIRWIPLKTIEANFQKKKNNKQNKTRRIKANKSKMHTISENSSGVPAFLAKLWRLVEDEETNNLIYWNAVSVYFQYIFCLPVFVYVYWNFEMCGGIVNYNWILTKQKKTQNFFNTPNTANAW